MGKKLIASVRVTPGSITISSSPSILEKFNEVLATVQERDVIPDRASTMSSTSGMAKAVDRAKEKIADHVSHRTISSGMGCGLQHGRHPDVDVATVSVHAT